MSKRAFVWPFVGSVGAQPGSLWGLVISDNTGQVVDRAELPRDQALVRLATRMTYYEAKYGKGTDAVPDGQ